MRIQHTALAHAPDGLARPSTLMLALRRRLALSRLLLLSGVFTCLVTADHRVTGQPLDPGQVKAAFVMNFLRFVDWPPSRLGSPSSPLTVGVIGDPSLVDVLARSAAGELVNGHPVLVRAVASPGDAREMHLLFIGTSEAGNLPGILKAIENAPLLTVGDTDGFGRAGVVLNLYTFDQRIRIEVNTTAAARVGLHLSAHLLRIARIVG